MALNLQNKYPGRFDPTSADYPQGKFKNRSSPTAQDGSYMERDWLNDWAGFFGALLNNASVTPNGAVDTAQSSQMYNALWTVIQKLLPKRSFTGSDFVRVPDVAGGMVIQWGTVVVSAGVSGGVITYPVQFPNGTASLIFSPRGLGAAGNTGKGFYVDEPSLSSKTSAKINVENSLPSVQNMFWIAVGF